MNRKSAEGAPHIAYPILLPLRGLGGSFVENVIMARSAIV